MTSWLTKRWNKLTDAVEKHIYILLLSSASALLIFVYKIRDYLFVVLSSCISKPIVHWQLSEFSLALITGLILLSIVSYLTIYVYKLSQRKKSPYDFIKVSNILWRYNRHSGNCDFVPYCKDHVIAYLGTFTAREYESFQCSLCPEDKSLNIPTHEYKIILQTVRTIIDGIINGHSSNYPKDVVSPKIKSRL